MANLSLTAKKRERTTKGTLLRMRKEGRVPAIVYGLDAEPEMVEVSATELRPHLSYRNHVIDLNVEGKSQQVMLKMVERDPIRKDLVLIDFLRVNNERPVIVAVPVTTHGVPIGVKVDGGVFSVMKKFVKLRAKITDIPDNFDIDVSDLAHGTIFYVKDLKFPKGSFVTPGKTALFGVTTSKAEDLPAAPVAAAATAEGAAAPAGAPSAPGVAPKEDKKEEGKDKGKEKK